MKLLTLKGRGLQQLIERRKGIKRKKVEETVRRIIDDVRLNGDAAVVKYTRRFDRVNLEPKQWRVGEAEISAAFQNITADFLGHLKTVINNVSRFHRHQKKRFAASRSKTPDGGILKEDIAPLDSVGVYIPAGTAPLISTVYMTVIPAKVAGVKRIVLSTPPDENGCVNPYILTVASLLKVDEIYKIGGAQAIAAMALGTRTVEKVDKIVGPGNWYVTEAKRQLYGEVDIDMLAGPSELVIIANRFSPPDYVAADLEAQLEHTGGLSVLITNSRRLIRQLRGRVKGGFCIHVKNMDEAVDVANRLAPEHLQILTNNAAELARRVRHAGAVFLGPHSPTALGDYAAGPSHVLPTMGTARFYSGLCLSHFLRRRHVVSFNRKALEALSPAIQQIATLERLPKHAASIAVRFSQP